MKRRNIFAGTSEEYPLALIPSFSAALISMRVDLQITLTARRSQLHGLQLVAVPRQRSVKDSGLVFLCGSPINNYIATEERRFACGKLGHVIHRRR
jgi:hypothetical protein